MKGTFGLEDLEQSGRGAKTRFITRLKDEEGVERYEVVVAGPREGIKRSFGDAKIEFEIDASAGKAAWAKDVAPLIEDSRRRYDDFSALENVPELFKKKGKLPPRPTVDKTGFVSVRALERGGTKYSFTVTGFAVPLLWSWFFTLPPVCSTFGVVTPASGDQDLLLNLAWPPIGPIRVSAAGGLSVDAIFFSVFCTPFTQFGPIWQVFGFRPGICGTFAYGGTDVFG